MSERDCVVFLCEREREEESDKNRDRDREIDIIGIIGSQRETLEAF